MKKILLPFFAVSLLISGCERSSGSDHELEAKRQPTFTAPANMEASIGIYLVNSVQEQESYLLKNEPFISKNGMVTSKNGISFIDQLATAHTAIAYAPYDESMTGDLQETGTWTLPVDYTQPNALVQGEWLYAKTEVSEFDAAIPLSFKRLNASVVLRISLLGFLPDNARKIKAVLVDQPSEATVNLAEGSVVPTDANTTMLMQTTGQAPITAQAYILPNNFEEGRKFAIISVDGIDYPLSSNAALTIETGCQYTWNITIQSDKGIISNQMRINDWTLAFESTVDPDVDSDNSLQDIDQNEYSFVEIGGYYWMAQNLRVTRLNDGTPLHFVHTENSDEFPLLTTGAYCVFNHLPAAENPNSVLYNYYAVETDKLCPEGWHVPSYDEWVAMADVFGGIATAGEALKSETGWMNNGNGTNASGLNFLPVGVYEGSFKQFEKFTYVWSNTPVANKPTMILAANMSYSAKTLKFWSWGSAKHRGYSVRCIKKLLKN
ncbi:MAG: FISUMP domain-containing protein [Alistipes sp.]